MKFLIFLALAITGVSLSGAQTLSSATLSSPYNAIFSFGDSISDTGNILISGVTSFQKIGQFPYGETFFGHPTGRYSDGRLIVDFFAEACGLPYLPPYLALSEESENYRGGVNFAFSGATALDGSESSMWKINVTLSVQLGWFKKVKRSLCASEQGCDKFLKKSLFLVGEIGGNDYNFPLLDGQTTHQVEPLIPSVVEAINNAIITLIEEGATDLVVPGLFPLGCAVIYLSKFQSPNKTDYDSFGCLKAFNAFTELHNSQLNRSLETLRHKHPHAKIIYADYYGATMQFIHAPERYGFHKESLLVACCGGGGQYNYNPLVPCGSKQCRVCKDPSSFASWDGVHYTEAAYQVIFEGLLYGYFTSPPLTLTYSSPIRNVI